MTNGTAGEIAEGVKAQSSVIDRPDPPSSRAPVPTYDYASQIFMLFGQGDSDFPGFLTRGKGREIALRNFITQEPIFCSALGIICYRNAGFSWKIDGPPRTAARVQEIFDTANEGEGWHDLVIKTSIDLYSQDDGAFWEIVRREDKPNSPVVTINHLDSQRCFHTGAPEAPVIYVDRMGTPHLLKKHNVITFSEMPVPIEGFYGRQYSALTRLLRGVQTMRNIGIYNFEKTAGRNYKAIHLVKGITSQQITDAIVQAKAQADAAGTMRFMNPVVAGSIDPTADVGHDTIEMVGMPEGWKEEEAHKIYINLISMAFASDYQEFAPLPGGGLGTGNQSEILHLKNRGKGPGLFMKLISHAINFRILPENLEFFWSEQDLEAEKSDAEVRAIRAQTRATRIQSGEIIPAVARQIANDEGDMGQEFIAMMGEEDLTENVSVLDDTQATAQSQDLGKPIVVPRPDPDRTAARQPNPTAARPRQPQRNP